MCLCAPVRVRSGRSPPVAPTSLSIFLLKVVGSLVGGRGASVEGMLVDGCLVIVTAGGMSQQQ